MSLTSPVRVGFGLPIKPLCGVSLVLLFAATAPAFADDVTEAMTAMQRGDRDTAHTHLVAIVESDAVAPSALLRAAWIAMQLEDRDVFERIRAVSERREEEGLEDPVLGLALGYAYLGLAEYQLRTRTGGSSTALLFADAEVRARPLLPDHDAAATYLAATYLAARARHAQGDLDGALSILARVPADASGAFGPALAAMRGSFLYERGAAVATAANGALTTPARADLSAAAALLPLGLAPGAPLAASETRRLRLILAWTEHRLGHLKPARSAYLAAHESGGETARLARRGLISLFASDPSAQLDALRDAARQRPADPAPLDDLIRTEVQRGLFAEALISVQHRRQAFPMEPDSYRLGGDVLARMGQWDEAAAAYVEALRLDAGHAASARGLEQVAQQLVRIDLDRALATYETLLTLRPEDPYCRNNLGFILREVVSRWTDARPGGIQTLKPDAPKRMRHLLEQCRAAYAAAVALIPAADDESRDLLESWNLAGIVNDYGLMLHYFTDIQDPARAEQMYLRALRMTEDGFKDTYSPNLQRLYTYVLTGRELSWYRLARRARDAVLRERLRDGRLELVPDPRKREAAEKDARRLRAQLVLELGRDAAEDGAPWPPALPKGKSR